MNALRESTERETDPIHLEIIARKTFHQLWGKDKGTVDYDKDMWIVLQMALSRLGVKV